ncbi:alpha/beta hydrolase [Rugosimonospora acidiphila]|uniref:Alpha/beta hydrolase n=1 Tax=Rugosimonospora acidiphila TaxID=556531 RepID=A0ABP9SIS8_9ACTN
MPYFKAGDETSLYYRDWGQGRPVVLLASQGLSSGMWQHLMSGLVDAGFRCLAYDRRGHGRSDEPRDGYDFDTLADDLAALMSHVDVREATLVGHSMGGAEIVRYLTRHGSQRVSRIALVSATLPFLLRTDENPGGIDRSVFEGVWAEWGRDWPGWIAANTPPFVGAGLPACHVSPEIVAWGTRDMERTSLYALSRCSRIVVETDFRAELAEVRVPALVIHGTADASNPIDLCGRRSAQILPAAALAVYDGAPHGLFITHLPRLLDDIRGFAAAAAEGSRVTTDHQFTG